MLTGLAGASLASYGARSRGVIGSIAGMAGVALLARATANLELDHLIGVGGGREAVAIQKTINIAAPIGPRPVLALAHVVNLLAHELARVRAGRLAFPGVLPRSPDRLAFRHDLPRFGVQPP